MEGKANWNDEKASEAFIHGTCAKESAKYRFNRRF
jgi:hypothetical protein